MKETLPRLLTTIVKKHSFLITRRSFFTAQGF